MWSNTSPIVPGLAIPAFHVFNSTVPMTKYSLPITSGLSFWKLWVSSASNSSWWHMISSHRGQYLHVLPWRSGPHSSTWMNRANFRGYVSLLHLGHEVSRVYGNGLSMNVYRGGRLPRRSRRFLPG